VKITSFFARSMWWIGAAWDAPNRVLTLLPLPTLGVRIALDDTMYTPTEAENLRDDLRDKAAHLASDKIGSDRPVRWFIDGGVMKLAVYHVKPHEHASLQALLTEPNFAEFLRAIHGGPVSLLFLRDDVLGEPTHQSYVSLWPRRRAERRFHVVRSAS